MVFAAGAFVVFARRRISADDKKILAGGKALMPCSSGQDCNVACFASQGTTKASAELHLAFTAGNAEHFMNTGMVVHIVVNAVTPGIAPAVAFEQFFDHSRRIELFWKPHCPAINDERPFRMVGNDSIVLEMKCTRLPFADEGAEIIAGRARPTGDLLRDFFHVFERGHGCYPFSGLRNQACASCVSAGAASAVEA